MAVARNFQSRCSFGWWLALGAAVLGPGALHGAAAEPNVRQLNLRGLQIGGMTTLVFDGDDLGAAPRLLVPLAVKVELKPGGTDKRATFDVLVDEGVSPGFYQAQLVAEGGVTLPVVMAVDRLPQRVLAAMCEQAPAALHGALTGSTVVETTLAGKAGQRVCLEVEAQRLGGKLRPVVHLYNARRRQLAWAWTTPMLAGDARLEAVLPEDGTYIIAVHDAEYAGAAPGHFRLKVGEWSWVDQVFPPVVGPGERQSLELLGSAAAARLDLPPLAIAGSVPLALPAGSLWSGPRPFVEVSALPVVLEQSLPPNATQELPGAPIAVCGKLSTAFEEDRYRLPVVAGTPLRLDLFAERLGSPLDAALIVRNEQGGVLARGEDGPNTPDPVLDFTVPAQVGAIVVGVADALGRGGPRGIYRLTVASRPLAEASADFELSTPTPRVSLPVGGRRVVPVWLRRLGQAGAVEIAAAGLPAGAQLTNAVVPAEGEGTLVVVEQGAGGGAAVTTWSGRSDLGLVRPVVVERHPMERVQPWLAWEIALATTTAAAADFQVEWRNLPSDVAIIPGGKLVLPVKLTRPADASLVRLTVLTSQPPLLVNNQPDPNRALRQEMPIELAANQPEGEVVLLVPGELPAALYDVAVQAELLAADKRVLRVACTTAQRLTVRVPLVIALAGPARVETTLDAKQGAMVKLVGQIDRRDGLTGDVVLTLSGLPPGARADTVTVKADGRDFMLNVTLPANFPTGESTGLKLFGLGAPDPKLNNVRVRSRDVDLVLVVQPPKAN